MNGESPTHVIPTARNFSENKMGDHLIDRGIQRAIDVLTTFFRELGFINETVDENDTSKLVTRFTKSGSLITHKITYTPGLVRFKSKFPHQTGSNNIWMHCSVQLENNSIFLEEYTVSLSSTLLPEYEAFAYYKFKVNQLATQETPIIDYSQMSPTRE